MLLRSCIMRVNNPFLFIFSYCFRCSKYWKKNGGGREIWHEERNIEGQVKGTLHRFEYELISFTSFTFKLVRKRSYKWNYLLPFMVINGTLEFLVVFLQVWMFRQWHFILINIFEKLVEGILKSSLVMPRWCWDVFLA